MVLLPFGLWFTYAIFPPQIGLELDIFAFLLFMMLVASMPMMINGTPVFFLQWASLSVFLSFGLFVETVLVQIALLALLIQMKIEKKSFFRFPMNSSMFFLVSFFSGIFYNSFGGMQGGDIFTNSSSMIVAFFYPLIYFVLNALFIFLIDRLVYQRKGRFFTKDLVWEFITTVITYPVGIALYIMYQDIGLLALMLIGIPFISLSLILRLYHSSESINDYLTKIAEIGHQLSQKLYVKETIDFFIGKLFELIKIDFVFIHKVNRDNELEMIARVEQKKELPLFTNIMKENEGICGHVLSRKKTAVYHSQETWKNVNKGYMPEEMESVLCMPMLKNNKVIGILLLGSKQKRAFAKTKLMILDLLCTQFAVAFENAKYFEKTKENSEKCALTKLYNYRYFDQILSEKFDQLDNQSITNLTLIMLDIDHFKSVNDTYGHQAGNEILVEFASRLQQLIGKHGIVARYGGEEFVILLTNTDLNQAFDLAEFLRKTIATRPFTIKQNINQQQKEVQVTITASLGLANAPDNADEPLALIRHADRALYVGAKRAGRNRVASYIK